MKKFLAIVLTIVMVMSCSVVAFAESTTTLTLDVAEATYTLVIPASQNVQGVNWQVPFAELEGELSIQNAFGFADGKNINVKVNCPDFEAEGVSTKIPYYLSFGPQMSGSISTLDGIYTFHGNADGTVEKYYKHNGNDCTKVFINVNEDAMHKALAGTYTSVVTFTAEVVAEQ